MTFMFISISTIDMTWLLTYITYRSIYTITFAHNHLFMKFHKSPTMCYTSLIMRAPPLTAVFLRHR